jgi:hypothetical protein
VVNEPAEALFTARIDSPLVIPTGVDLLRVDATGKTLSIAGTMRDNGSNGDAVAGDKVFTLGVTVSEATAGETSYRVSAAFKGSLRRELSSIVAIHIDPFLLPPDPGELGKLTLEGIDSDRDGIRDDIQRYIELTYHTQLEVRHALRQYVVAEQSFLLGAVDRETARVAVSSVHDAQNCLFAIVGGVDEASTLRKALTPLIYNTEERTRARLVGDSLLSGEVFDGVRAALRRAKCQF